jgi:hypothetical protein
LVSSAIEDNVMQPGVLITDHAWEDIGRERRILEAAGAVGDRVAIIGARHAGRTGATGAGHHMVDNMVVAAASERGIAVINVPDYCVDEVLVRDGGPAGGMGRPTRGGVVRGWSGGR